MHQKNKSLIKILRRWGRLFLPLVMMGPLRAPRLPLSVPLGETAAPAGDTPLVWCFPIPGIDQCNAYIWRRSLQQKQYRSDPLLDAYLDEITTQLLSNVQIPQRYYENPWLHRQTWWVADGKINAYATIASLFCMHTRLLLETANEAEFAMVVGHELAHLCLGHVQHFFLELSNRRIEEVMTAAATSIAIMMPVLLPILSPILENRIYNQGAHSRAHEQDADRFGLLLLSKAGWDPEIGKQVFEKFDTNARNSGLPPRRLMGSDEQQTMEQVEQSWRQSHPYTEERSDRLNAYIEDLPAVRHTRGRSPEYWQAKARILCLWDTFKQTDQFGSLASLSFEAQAEIQKIFQEWTQSSDALQRTGGYYGLALVESLLKRYGPALDLLKKINVEYQVQPWVRYLALQCRLGKGEQLSSSDFIALNQSIAARYGEKTSLLMMGELYMQAQDFPQALVALEKALHYPCVEIPARKRLIEIQAHLGNRPEMLRNQAELEAYLWHFEQAKILFLEAAASAPLSDLDFKSLCARRVQEVIEEAKKIGEEGAELY